MVPTPARARYDDVPRATQLTALIYRSQGKTVETTPGATSEGISQESCREKRAAIEQTRTEALIASAWGP